MATQVDDVFNKLGELEKDGVVIHAAKIVTNHGVNYTSEIQVETVTSDWARKMYTTKDTTGEFKLTLPGEGELALNASGTIRGIDITEESFQKNNAKLYYGKQRNVILEYGDETRKAVLIAFENPSDAQTFVKLFTAYDPTHVESMYYVTSIEDRRNQSFRIHTTTPSKRKLGRNYNYFEVSRKEIDDQLKYHFNTDNANVNNLYAANGDTELDWVFVSVTPLSQGFIFRFSSEKRDTDDTTKTWTLTLYENTWCDLQPLVDFLSQEVAVGDGSSPAAGSAFRITLSLRD